MLYQKVERHVNVAQDTRAFAMLQPQHGPSSPRLCLCLRTAPGFPLRRAAFLRRAAPQRTWKLESTSTSQPAAPALGNAAIVSDVARF